ncbi:MAG: hypothetical protein HYV63_13325 [Candidatus Schekmanbacteria bacterium]|nr:hypothetical protein [Candidatus Schekmanbacteria bacterium]
MPLAFPCASDRSAATRVIAYLSAWLVAGLASLACAPAPGPADDPVAIADLVATPPLATANLLWQGSGSSGAEYKVTAMAAANEGVFVATSNVYSTRQANHSAAFLIGYDGVARRVYSGPEESIGPLFGPYMTVEHGPSVLQLRNGRVREAIAMPQAPPGTLGCSVDAADCNWSIVGALAWNGAAALTYNLGPYKQGQFFDSPKLLSIDASPPYHFSLRRLQATVQGAAFHDGVLWLSTSFGWTEDDNALVRLNAPSAEAYSILEETRGSDVGALHWFAGSLYGGGGRRIAEGSSAPPAALYELSDDRWRAVLDTGSETVNQLLEACGKLWIATTNPDRVLVMDAFGEIAVVAEHPDEGNEEDPRSFGSTFDLRLEREGNAWRWRYYWARSDLHRAYLYELVPQASEGLCEPLLTSGSGIGEQID